MRILVLCVFVRFTLVNYWSMYCPFYFSNIEYSMNKYTILAQGLMKTSKMIAVAWLLNVYVADTAAASALFFLVLARNSSPGIEPMNLSYQINLYIGSLCVKSTRGKYCHLCKRLTLLKPCIQLTFPNFFSLFFGPIPQDLHSITRTVILNLKRQWTYKF